MRGTGGRFSYPTITIIQYYFDSGHDLSPYPCVPVPRGTGTVRPARIPDSLPSAHPRIRGRLPRNEGTVTVSGTLLANQPHTFLIFTLHPGVSAPEESLLCGAKETLDRSEPVVHRPDFWYQGTKLTGELICRFFGFPGFNFSGGFLGRYGDSSAARNIPEKGANRYRYPGTVPTFRARYVV